MAIVIDAPVQLLNYRQWVAWRAVPLKTGKTDKIPINPHTGGMAKSDTPTTWGTLSEATERAQRDDLAGIGFVFTNTPYAGVDLDNCVDPNNGGIKPWAQEKITQLDSYAEISPSGTGVHILVAGDLPDGGRKKGDIEMYDSGRFFTFTGDHVDGTPLELHDRTDVLKQLHRQIFGDPAPQPTTTMAPAPTATLDDQELIDRMFNATNGDKIAALWAGDTSGHPSQSEADLALCNALAFWTGRNTDQMDRLFRQSGLYRDKWDEKRGAQTYGEMTMQTAIENTTEVYTPKRGGNGRGTGQATPAGTTEGRRRKPPMSAEFIKALTDMGYTFRLNATDDNVEVNGQPISDVTRAEIRVRMRDADYRRHLAAIEDAYVTAAAANAYHPVIDYLAGLTYDGLGHIDKLAAHFEDTHGVFATYLKRWLVGAVARTMATVTKGAQNSMLAVDGGQGIGKSFFVRWLCSPLPGMFVDAPIVPGDKDCDILLMTAWIWEVSELGATTRKADRESLKAFISKELVTVRKPYGHYPVRKPALASFIGTVNNESGILSDPTGNRRFNVCTVTAIDWAYTKAVNLDALWAEALALYQAKEPWQLTREEMRRAAEVNEEYMTEDPIEGLLRKHFQLDAGKADADWMIPTIDIVGALQNLGLTGSTKGNAMALAATMKRLGMKRYRKDNVRGYYGVKVKL